MTKFERKCLVILLWSLAIVVAGIIIEPVLFLIGGVCAVISTYLFVEST